MADAENVELSLLEQILTETLKAVSSSDLFDADKIAELRKLAQSNSLQSREAVVDMLRLSPPAEQ